MATTADAAPPEDPSQFITPPYSCIYTCPYGTPACSEQTTPYACQNLGSWGAIPHADSCGAWDGGYPAVKPGQCTVSSPTGASAAYANRDVDAGPIILPDGRRLTPAGSEWVFNEPTLAEGDPVATLLIPGTKLALVVDDGYEVESVRLIDTTKLIAGQDPVLAFVEFDPPGTPSPADAGGTKATGTLTHGIVLLPAALPGGPVTALISTGEGIVRALSVDATAKTIVLDPAHALTLPMSINDVGKPATNFVSSLALSPDNTRLVVTSVFDQNVLVYDMTQASYGTLVATIPLNVPAANAGVFNASFNPNNPTSTVVYLTLNANGAVAAIDIKAPTAPIVTYPTDKSPQGLAFLDARWLVASNDFGDTLTVIDTVAGTSSSMAIDTAEALHGTEPSNLAYDPVAKRLYATLAAINAIGAWDVDLSHSPPTFTPAGRLPTSWWPSSVTPTDDGSLIVTNMRGHSSGPIQQAFAPSDGEAMKGTGGTIQMVAPPSSSDLSAGDTQVGKNNVVSKLPGSPAVTCPSGVSDFPLPPTNTTGPSPVIKHVFFIVRENKDFDGMLGDMPGVNGDPTLTAKTKTSDMDKLWLNFRNLVRTFSTSDNYYTSAELSVQGHTWTTFGRSSDFTERTWALAGYSRNLYTSQVQPQGIASVGRPIEGSLFDWLAINKVQANILGEAEGLPTHFLPSGSPVDTSYPGGFIQSMGYPDIEKSCYIAGLARVACSFAPFAYMTLSNDHTTGVNPGTASPELMIATNDEATGMMVDAISHSPLWASSLIIVTEDDPSGGGDHVEHHRTPILFASPWIRHGYVSKTHIDISSVHKIFAHVYGIPYPSAIVENAGLPLDLFSSTPDYTPYTYSPRQWPATCGVEPTPAEKYLQSSWDFDDIDEQEGLGEQVWRYLRGTPYDVLPERLEKAATRRILARGIRKPTPDAAKSNVPGKKPVDDDD